MNNNLQKIQNLMNTCNLYNMNDLQTLDKMIYCMARRDPLPFESDLSGVKIPSYTTDYNIALTIRPWEPIGVGNTAYGNTQIGKVSGGWIYTLYYPSIDPNPRPAITSELQRTELFSIIMASLKAIDYERTRNV